MNCVTHIQNHLQPIFVYSGKSINNIGNYQGCLEAEGMNYFAILLGDATTKAIAAGVNLCLPEQCTPNQVKFILTYLLQQIHIPFVPVAVHNDVQNYSYPYDWRFFLTIFIVFTLVALVFLASVSRTIGSHKILSAFSLKNSLKIYKYNESRLNTFNGVKSLSMLWVIFGHEHVSNLATVSNILSIGPIFETWYALLIQSGIFAVDAFFFVGGFLVAYAVLKQKSKSLLKYPLAIFNRFLRLVPAYLFAMLIFSSILIHLGSGPLWHNLEGALQFCQNLWKSVFFVDNFVQNGTTMCMGWGWYLQNDMQIFIYCTLILIFYQWSKFASYMMIVWSMLGSFAFQMILTYNEGAHTIIHLTDTATQGAYGLDIYIKPYARCGPYLYGLLIGMLYTGFLEEEKNLNDDHVFIRLKQKMINNRKWKHAMEIVGLLLSAFCVFIPRTGQLDHYWPQLAHSLYLTYAKTLFVIGISFIILPSLLGVDSIIKFVLDTKMFNFIAKVSYCTYLIHLSLITMWTSSAKLNFYYAKIPLYSLFVSHAFTSIILGFIMTILVQIPFSKLQKLLMNFLLEKSIRKEGKKGVDLNQKNGESTQQVKKEAINGSIREEIRE